MAINTFIVTLIDKNHNEEEIKQKYTILFSNGDLGTSARLWLNGITLLRSGTIAP